MNSLILINLNKIRILLFLLLTLILNFSLCAQSKLLFGSTGQAPISSHQNDGFLDEVTKEMFHRIGYQIDFKLLPSERSLYSVNKGIIDGDMCRIKGLEKIYKNIIHVPEKIMETKFSVFSKHVINIDSGWSSFERKKIGYIRGWKILDINVPESAIVTKTKNAEQLFELLNKNRVDFIIYDQLRGDYILDKLNLRGIKLLSPILAKHDMFVYLNKKHKGIIPLLVQALKDMKKDGSYDDYVNKHLSKSPKITL